MSSIHAINDIFVQQRRLNVVNVKNKNVTKEINLVNIDEKTTFYLN